MYFSFASASNFTYPFLLRPLLPRFTQGCRPRCRPVLCRSPGGASEWEPGAPLVGAAALTPSQPATLPGRAIPSSCSPFLGPRCVLCIHVTLRTQRLLPSEPPHGGHWRHARGGQEALGSWAAAPCLSLMRRAVYDSSCGGLGRGSKVLAWLQLRVRVCVCALRAAPRQDVFFFLTHGGAAAVGRARTWMLWV